MYISQRSKELYDKIARGWNTWDVQSVTAHVYLPMKLRININFFVPHLNACSGNSLWDNVESFGEHSADGSYTEVNIKFAGGIYKIETSASGKELVIRITPVKERYNCFAAAEVTEIWGSKLQIGHDNDSIVVNDGNECFTVRSVTEKAAPKWNPITAHSLICKADRVVYFTVNSSKDAREIDEMIEEGRARWLSETISAEGELGEGLAALRRSLLWNMVYDSVNGRVVTPVSRNWCKRGGRFGDYVLFEWDTFFAAMQYGLIDKDLAYCTMFSMLEEITPEGMIPNLGSAVGWSRDRSEPQVGSMCAWKLYLQSGDKWFIEECFDRLLEWNRWRFREWDFNGDGLLELASIPWESDPDEEIWNVLECGKRQGAMWESGLDNSPMWDRAVFNEEKHCLELSYVGLNALMVADCEILEKMAALLGREEERKELEARRKSLADKINTELWDEKTGCYLNKHWSGEFDPCLSLTHFYTITAGIVNEERLDLLLNEHLLNEEEFWGDYVIPNVSRNDPSFTEQDYWRGRIWAPTNYIVGQGIARIKRTDIWDELVKKGLDMFIQCWREKGVVGENYNAITGEAAEKGKTSDPFYHWGALLVYMAVERIIYFNQWEDKVDMQDKPDWLSGIKNIPVGDKKINIG